MKPADRLVLRLVPRKKQKKKVPDRVFRNSCSRVHLAMQAFVLPVPCMVLVQQSLTDESADPPFPSVIDRGGIHRPRHRMFALQAVSWTDDTVDNEGMGKKSSKSAFHAQRQPLMSDLAGFLCSGAVLY